MNLTSKKFVYILSWCCWCRFEFDLVLGNDFCTKDDCPNQKLMFCLPQLNKFDEEGCTFESDVSRGGIYKFKCCQGYCDYSHLYPNRPCPYDCLDTLPDPKLYYWQYLPWQYLPDPDSPRGYFQQCVILKHPPNGQVECSGLWEIDRNWLFGLASPEDDQGDWTIGEDGELIPPPIGQWKWICSAKYKSKVIPRIANNFQNKNSLDDLDSGPRECVKCRSFLNDQDSWDCVNNPQTQSTVICNKHPHSKAPFCGTFKFEYFIDGEWEEGFSRGCSKEPIGCSIRPKFRNRRYRNVFGCVCDSTLCNNCVNQKDKWTPKMKCTQSVSNPFKFY